MKRAFLCCVLFVFCGVAYAAVQLEVGVNQLRNWSFEQGILGLCLEQANGDEPEVRRCIIPGVWEIEDYTPGTTGRIELDDKEVYSGNFSLKVTAAAIDGTAWHFKVSQDRLSFEGGKKHTIKFWAKAEAPRVVQVCLQMNHEPWDGWLWKDVNLTESWQEFVIEVTPPVDNDREHWLAFHCGQSLATWWLDDVRYYKGSPDDEKKSRPSIGSDDFKTQIAGELEPSALHVEGSRLVTADGNIVRLQGVSIPTLGISNTGGARLLESLRVAIHDWNANTIRLPLCQERWFGKAEGQRYGGQLYRLIVDEVVCYISENGCYVILELQELGTGPSGKEIYTIMPDMKSAEFWKDVATSYSNNPAVLFELYNETHDVSWDIWKFGGWVTENEITYEASGMQELLDVVRSTGARNIAVAGGLDWAYDLRGIPEYALEDPHGNVMYATHIYPWKGKEKDWNENIGHVIGIHPILVGEVGSEPGAWSPYADYDPYVWSDEVLSYIHKHELNWTAWCFDVLAGPPLLADWDYNPTPYWGDFVKRALKDEPYVGDAVPPWDANVDGKTDILDLVLVTRHFGGVIATPLYPNPDVNDDGEVDISDIILVGQHFGEIYEQ